MVFSSILFIFGFLPLFLGVYFLAPNALRNKVALFASMLFYAWGAPTFLLVLLAVSYFDYVMSLQMVKFPRSSLQRRIIFFVAVLVNLSMLFYFKYANFLVEQFDILLQISDPTLQSHWTKVIMPIGISFVVFEEISYLADVFSEVAPPAGCFSDYALFLFLFPHSIAGPIFRWNDIADQIKSRQHTGKRFFEGSVRFFFGLGKKALIADQVAKVADAAFQGDLAVLPWSYAWIGLLAYTVQIYFDFSGYSDMAIGMGRCLGFNFKENFNAPYSSSSITEFWHRWHISLSTWMRNYLYIPLGGNRIGAARTFFNLIFVFLISGFWHGANWTFIAWGGFHGSLLLLERQEFWIRWVLNRNKILKVFLTCVLVMFGWILFRSESITASKIYLYRLFAFTDADAYLKWSTSWGEFCSNRSLVALFIGLIFSFAPANQKFAKLCEIIKNSSVPDVRRGYLAPIQFSIAICLLVFSTMSLITSNFSPFIYFRF